MDPELSLAAMPDLRLVLIVSNSDDCNRQKVSGGNADGREM
jgi:hypothetical protein